MSRNCHKRCRWCFKLRASKPWHILAPICRFFRNGRIEASRNQKRKTFHHRGTEFAESEYFLIKNSLLGALRASAVSLFFMAFVRFVVGK